MLTYDSIIAFLEDSCAFLEKSLSPTEYNWSGYIIDRYDNGYRVMSSTRPDFKTFLDMLNIKNELPFLKRYVELLQNDTRYKHIRDNVGGADSLGHWLHPNSLLLTLLSDYLKEVDSIKFSKPTADMLTSCFLDSLKSQETRYCVFTPIKGLSGIPAPIDIEPNLQLRSLSDSEISSIMEDYQQDFFTPDFPGSTCIVELGLSVPVWQGVGDTSNAKQMFKCIVNSLRVLKDTDAISSTIYTRKKYRGSIGFGHGGGWSADPGWRSVSPSHVCTIQENEVVDLLAYYGSIKIGNLPARLKRSLNRLNFAIERDLPEDKLVDSLISLEALFGEGSGAIGYKIALRASVFLENEFSLRKPVNDFINASYNKRNALVHGKGSVQIDHVDHLTSIARRSIRKCMDLLIRDKRIPDHNDFDELLLL